MSSPPWFRLYSEILSDRKLKRVEVMTGQPKVIILGFWTVLLCMANDSPDRGRLLISDDMPITADEIIAETGLDFETGNAILEAFVSAGMIERDGEILGASNWDKRQFVSDTSNERVARYRERQRREVEKKEAETVETEAETEQEQEPDDTETIQPSEPNAKCNVTVTAPDTDTDTEEETDTNVVAAKAAPPKKKSQKPKTETVDDLLQASTPKKQIMGAFMSKANIPKMPRKKSDIGFWWSEINEIYCIAGEDVDKAKKLVCEAVDHMTGERLTISSPKSLVNIIRAMAAGTAGHQNGNGNYDAGDGGPPLNSKYRRDWEEMKAREAA